MTRATGKNLKLLITILGAQIAAMSLMLGAAALVIDSYSSEAEVADVDRKASQEAPARECSQAADLLDLIIF